MSCLNIMMTIFNVIFVLVGGSLLGVGIWMAVDPYLLDYLIITGEELFWEIAVYVIIGVGAIIFLVGLLGCVAACTENRIVVILYTIFAFLAIAAELGAIAFVSVIYANLDKLAQNMQEDLMDSYVEDANRTSEDKLSATWDKMQMQWKCCGSNYYTDYYNSNFENTAPPGVSVPWTCCMLKEGTDVDEAIRDDVRDHAACQAEAARTGFETYDNLHKNGCYYEMDQVMDLSALVILGVLFGFVLIQLNGMAMACTIRKRKKQDKKASAVAPETRAKMI